MRRLTPRQYPFLSSETSPAGLRVITDEPDALRKRATYDEPRFAPKYDSTCIAQTSQSSTLGDAAGSCRSLSKSVPCAINNPIASLMTVTRLRSAAASELIRC